MEAVRMLFNSKLVRFFAVLGLMFTLHNCDVLENTEDEDPQVTDTLFVKFTNGENSVASVYYFSYQQMGKADESATPTGDWSANVITNDAVVAPGGSVYFTLTIPNLHWARYHLGIVDTNGNKILLHEQANYQESNTPVTHWGADTRTISTTVLRLESTGQYYLSGYSDWAGID